MKIYHVETKEAYDELMSELEVKGCKWLSGYKPTSKNYWEENKEDSCINILGKYINFMDIERCKKQYTDTLIVEYKAKGENMKQEEEMKHKLQEVAKLYEVAFDISASIESFVRGTLAVEADLKEAKSSAKKLIEKIDEYLESQKHKFKVGDYVSIHAFNKEITKIEKIYDEKLHGFWYDTESGSIRLDYYFGGGTAVKHATPEEIAEYKVALTFYKHGRKPFEIKEGDIISYSESDKIFVDVPSFWGKEDFTGGDYTLLKTAEEFKEWIENK